MATTISTQDLIDVKRDIEDIGKAVNEKVIVSPRYGEDFKSLPMISAEGQAIIDSFDSTAQGKINEWDAAVDLITQQGGVPALAVSTADGGNQQDINDFGGAKWRNKAGGYALGATVKLDNGDIVKSTIADNTANPNVDMTGWVKTNDASQIFDKFGDSLQVIVDKFLKLKTIAFESLGGVGDGNRLTGAGTDNADAFDLAQIYGEAGYEVTFHPHKQYKTTRPITVHNMRWVGDEGCTPIIFGWFSTTGKRIIGRNPAADKKNATIDGITFWRCGPNPEHGINIDNMSGFYFRGRVLGVPYCNGGAVGVSAFYTERRPSQNVHIDVYLEQTGDYGVEYGDVQHGTLRVNGKDVWREVIGFEPLMRDVFTLTSANFSDNTFTVTNHGLITGDPIIYHSNGNPTLFEAGTYHFAIVIDANNFKIATTRNMAYKNVPTTTSVTFTGTQYVVRCSIIEDITVESCILNDVDSVKPPLFGNSQGYIVATATSGGWTGNINFNPPQINSMRKTQDGLTTIGIRIDGSSGLTIKEPTVIGCDTSIRVLRGELGNWTDKNGTRITVPTVCTMLPKDNVMTDPVLEDFKVQGIYAQHDATKFIGGIVRSKFSGAIGINDTTNLGGTTYTNVSVDCPNGTDLVSATAVLAQDLKLLSTGKQITSDFNDASARTLKPRAKKSGDAICEIKSTDQNRATAYMGTLEIMVTPNAGTAVADIGANKAIYKLQLTKAYSGAAPTLALLSSYGLTTGAGATHPSFTFAMSGDSIIATAVASTSTTANFYFSIKSDGFINFV